MLLKRIELLLDPKIKELAFLYPREDGSFTILGAVELKDGDRVKIYEGVEVSRRTLED